MLADFDELIDDRRGRGVDVVQVTGVDDVFDAGFVRNINCRNDGVEEVFAAVGASVLRIAQVRIREVRETGN